MGQQDKLLLCYETFLVSNEGGATISEIIHLDGGSTATFYLQEKNGWNMVQKVGNESSVRDCEPLVEKNEILKFQERTKRGQVKNVCKQTLYWIAGRIPRDIGRLYRL